jgi:hypothetical protein
MSGTSKDGLQFIGWGHRGAEASKYGHVQLWNPAASGVEMICTKMFVSSVAARLPVYSYHTQLAVNRNPVSLRIDGTAPSGECRALSDAGAVGTTLLTEFLFFASETLKVIDLADSPIVLAESKGFLVRTEVVNVELGVMFIWNEREL